MIDLRKDVTVFVLTVGDHANFYHCMENLHKQDCMFRLVIISRVAPATAAMQHMVDSCETPYAIQCDEDMILDRNAVSKLYHTITNGPSRSVLWCMPLWDEHLIHAILGIKIYRMELMRKYSYHTDSPACEIDINKQILDSGYEIGCAWKDFTDIESCIGKHGVHYTPATAYNAYFSRALKSRLHPEQVGWVRTLPSLFRRLMKIEPDNPIHLYALLGYVAGLNADLSQQKFDKDYRIVNTAFAQLQEDLER